MTGLSIAEWLHSPVATTDLDQLATLLHAVVQDGASVSFVLPFSEPDARAWWSETVLPALLRGARRLIIARLDGRIVGAIQLVLETPPNQQHRADVAKLLVHPDARRRGIARALMQAVEDLARQEHRTLLTLDTRTGDHAEPLYVSMGYTVAGVIPRYTRSPQSPELESTTILYKQLDPMPE